MFVGIDEFDAPANNLAFDGGSPEAIGERSRSVSATERFLESSLFSVLKGGCGHAISKYFLTGVRPAFQSMMSPLIATEIISTRPDFHGICGFTADQVKIFVRTYLGSSNSSDTELDHICWVMQRYYSGYRFAGTIRDQLEALSNPQLIYHFLSEFKSHGLVRNPGESPVVHIIKILKSIADTGDFSVESDIIQLMATGFLGSSIVNDFEYEDLPAELGSDRVTTLSLLVYLGVLTRNAMGDQLRIPNEVMKSQVYKPTSFHFSRMLKKCILGFSPRQGIYKFPGGVTEQGGTCKHRPSKGLPGNARGPSERLYGREGIAIPRYSR